MWGWARKDLGKEMDQCGVGFVSLHYLIGIVIVQYGERKLNWTSNINGSSVVEISVYGKIFICE